MHCCEESFSTLERHAGLRQRRRPGKRFPSRLILLRGRE